MTKKRFSRIVCVALVLALAAAWAIYAAPRRAEQIVRDLDFDECTRITLEATEYPTDHADDSVYYSLVLEKGDEDFDALVRAISGQKFSRKALGVLSKHATKIHSIRAGDSRWSAHCVCGERVFRIEDYFGDMSMRADPGDIFAKLRPTDKAAFSAEVFAIIKQNPGTTVKKDF